MAEPTTRESFECTFLENGQRVTMQAEGIRVSKHFAFILGAITHIPSGFAVPYSSSWSTVDARARAECLEALSFIDWDTKDPAAVELTEEQQALLRDASKGKMPPTEFRRAEVRNG